MVEISALMRLQEEILMIDLTGKRVFVRTQEEYLSVLKMAKLQGFKWARGEKLDAINIPIPNLLNFYDDIVTYYSDDIPLFEASEIVACEEKIKEAIAHVKYFANNKYRMSLTDKVIDSMLLLADTVESQMEEVKY
jgi:KaiC/GvpD/RAD55 family RecA-like ATPase